MAVLKHPVTGHEITTSEESVDFWSKAGYRSTETKPAPKSTAKKASSTKKSSK